MSDSQQIMKSGKGREEQLLVDDHSLERVPIRERYGWFPVAVQRFGQISALSQFLLGAALGFGMTFGSAVLAVTLGAVILEVVTIFVGVIGMREGLNTSVIARWTGFGTGGSALVGLAIGISLVGWFGIQSGVSATGLQSLMPALPTWAWSMIFGLVITGVVIRGFHLMQNVAYVTVPAFLILVGWAFVREIETHHHSIAQMAAAAPAGAHISLIAGTTLVAGGFIVGAVITPDMSRFNRSIADVIKQTVVGITLGEYGICLVGILLAHAVRTSNIMDIIISDVGWVGVLVIVLGTFKINDWNLYSSGLGVVNFIDTVFGRKLNRSLVTLIVGVAGTLLAAGGILNHFIGFLTVLGVAFPPIPGIMIAEYFVVKKWRPDLKAAGTGMPAHAPIWVPATLVIWLAAFLIGKYVTFGLPSINAVVSAFVLYVVAGKLGLVRGYGRAATRAAEDVVAEP
jgi:cytosine permease